MNKLLIVLLAVCLAVVSTHAFVRRDAPAPPEQNDSLKKLGDTLNEVGESFSSGIKKVFDPETIKKGFDNMVDNISKTVEGFKAKPSS